MKSIPVILGVALASVLTGCSSTPVSLAPVGPGPFTPQAAALSTGGLQVYSAMVGRTEGDNPSWYQHTDYYLRDTSSQENRRIDNTVGHYSQRPRTVYLTSGTYMVKAEASSGKWVEVPVVIKSGETTFLHLDGQWNPATISQAQIVKMPDGYAVGWHGNLTATGKID